MSKLIVSKKETAVHKAGLGSGYSFWSALSQFIMEVSKKYTWKRFGFGYSDQAFKHIPKILLTRKISL